MRPIPRILLCQLFPFLIAATLFIGTERLVNKMHTTVVAPLLKQPALLYIPTGATFKQVIDSLNANPGIRRIQLIEKVMQLKGYDQHIKPGCYQLHPCTSADQLTDLLIRGLQTPIKVRFHHIRKPQELAGVVARQIEADSLSLLQAMTNQNFLKENDLTQATIFVLMIPNTYELWWNSDADAFLKRMTLESRKFWNDQRKKAAREAGLTIPEVVTLASIVETETAKNSEKPIIAGVYINRIHRGWPLQADPTLIYAWDDFTIKRVLNKHKKIDSPYNTYKHKGLPPGPICLPSIASIDAVLNYNKHDYMYFCAKEDFSGYHVFAETHQQHQRNAKKYRKALDEIRRKR